MIIYVFTNKINGKKYVGQTSRNFKERVGEHLRRNVTYFDKALKKYGISNFDYEIVDNACSIDELNEKEKFWIVKNDSMIPNGYNLCEGGGVTVGYTHSMESKIKMSISKRESGVMRGTNNHYYGKRHTPEIREKMAQKWTEERRNEQSRRSREMDRSYLFVKVRNMDTGEIYNSVKEASNVTGVLATHITRVCKGKRKSAGGIRWEYTE